MKLHGGDDGGHMSPKWLKPFPDQRGGKQQNQGGPTRSIAPDGDHRKRELHYQRTTAASEEKGKESRTNRGRGNFFKTSPGGLILRGLVDTPPTLGTHNCVRYMSGIAQAMRRWRQALDAKHLNRKIG